MPRTGASRPSESSPLLPRRTSGIAGASSSHRRASPRDVVAVSRDSSSKLSVSSAATTAAASSLSVNNSSGGVPSFGDGISSSDSLNRGNGGGSRARSEESGGSDTRAGGGGRGGASIFGSAPTSLSGFCAIFAHSVALQSWTSYVLAVGFHLFHVVLILSFLFSPILFRSTIFSSQTMAKSLLEAQGVIKHRSGSGSRGSADKENGKAREASTSLLPSSVSQSLVAVESIWAIHDAVFFLEPGHVVVPTSIENSFGSLRHGKGHKKGDDKNRKDSKGSSDAGKGNDADAGDADDDDEDDNEEGDDDGGDATHTYVVPHGGSGNKAKLMVSQTGGVAPALERAAAAAMGAKVEEVPGSKRSLRVAHVLASDVAHDSPGPLFNFAAPPPVIPQRPLSQRKSATHGRATLSKILNAWEASPLYSSPLALTLFYYLYNIGCIILLFTVTDGMLTGHFSVLRLIISLAELLWYVHHGAHAFVIYCWLVLLSHWPHHATHSPSDLDYLRFGTPYAVVEKGTGKVDMYWFYRAASGEGGSGKGKLLQDQLDMQYYLYDQVWYLKPIASGVAVAYLILLSFCIARDLHRMLDAVVGVRVLMEPEGCVRCPLCGELMEICQQHRNARGKSMYQSARDGTSLSVRRTVWWLRWIRSAVRGSSSGHRVPTPRLRSPLWRWLLPEWLGGGPQRVADEAAREAAMNSGAASTSLEAFTTGDGPYTMADMLEDIEFYEQSAIRRSAAAPQDTMTEETAHLMRWLTVVPKSDPSVAVPVRGERSVTSSSADEEAVEALGIGSSGSSSSEDEVERGLVKAVPAGQGPTGRLPAAAARRVSSPSSRGLRSPMRRRCSGQRRRHNSTSPGSTSSSQQQQQQQQQHQLAQPLPKPHRVTRFAEEVLYWNYATRHVHHRCPKLYLDAQEATDDEDDESDTDASGTTGSSSEASSSVASSVEAAAPTRGMKERRITGTLAATTTPSRAHVGDAATAASRANFADRGMRRSLSPRAHSRRDGSSAAAAAAPSAMEEQRRRQQQQQQPALQRTMSVPITAGSRGATTASAAAAAGALYTVSGPVRSYGTIGPNFSEAPSQLFAREQPAQAAANHIVQRGVYDPTKDEEDEFRPGNAFQSFDRAGWLSRLTYSWLNPLLSFGLLEPTLLRQERFLPALPEHLLSLDNIAVPAWRLWVHRKTWYARYVAKPGELLIPSNEAMERAEEQVMSLADLHDAETSDEGDETESSEGHQTVVMLGHTSLKQAAKFRPQRPRRSWEERLLWSVTAPLRYLLVGLFYYTYIGTSRTVRRTRRRLVRELLKDRLVAAAEDMYDENGYQAMEANEALEEATWALAEMASSCGSSAVAPSAGSALPTHMRRQLALSDVSLYHLFLEHRCGRRFLLVAAPLLLLSELLTLSLVPVLVLFVQFLQKVDTVEILPGRRQARGDEENVTYALCLAALVGVLLLLQGVAQSAYVSEVQQAAMEARTCVRAMVMEKTLALPLAQRTFSEAEVVTLATEEATRVAACLVSLHHTWSCPLRVVLLALLLGYYLGWAAAGVACVGPLFVVPWLRYAGHEKRQSLHTAKEATQPRLSLLQQALGHIREVKGMLLEGRLMRQLSKARQGEAGHAEEAAMADGTSGMLSGGVTGLLLVAALGAEFVFSEKVLRDVDVLIPTLVIFLLLTAPVLEVPALFTVVARGFLSMKRIEAYLRQTPDEFVGTWVDLTSFSAMQQQLRKENPRSALLHYRRGSVVCRDSSFTWQHDLTEESPVTLLRGVDVCIEPGQLVVVQGSMGSGKSTLLLSILGEVNRCVSAKGSDAGGGSSVTDFESESSFSVVSASEAEAAVARASVPPHGAENDSMYSHAGSNTTAHTMPFPARGSISGADGGAAAAAAAAAVAAHGIFVASPTESGIGHQHQQQRAGGDAAYSPPFTTTNATAAGRKGRDDAKPRAASTTGRKSPHTTHSSDYDGAESTAAPTEASQRAPAGLEDGESSTGGFLVFGSCAYCAEAPWLQNDTIRANIMSSGGPVQQERWYYTVLRACALSAEVAALPQGDATVVGDCGEVLSLSMRCRIAIARAVYSKSHVYLFDSVLSPLEPAMQEHIIHEVFHKLLRKRTVILASNVGLRSLRPHRVFSLVESGLVREDTQLYKAVPSLNARSDDEDEEGETEAGGESGSGSGAGDTRTGGSSRSSTSSATSQGTAAPLPPLFAEEFEEPREESDLDAPQTFDNDPMAAATTLLFDGDEDFGPRDPLFPELGDRHDGAGADMAMSSSFFYSNSGGNSGVLRPRRSGHLGPRSPTRMDPQQRSLGTSGRTSPGAITLPPPAIPFQDRGLRANGVAAAGGSPQSSTLMHDGPSLASEHGDSLESASARSAGEASSCSTGQYIRNHYAQQLERERMLRHRHRLSFFIFLRFMGSQVVWLVFTTFLYQLVLLGIDIWAAVWLAMMANAKQSDDTAAAATAAASASRLARARHQLYLWTSLTDTVFLGSVCVLTVLAMVLALLRARAVHVGVYGTMYFIYNQIVRRVLHAPASYFDSRIIALLTRVLESDAEVAEYRVPGTAEVLLSCAVQLALIAIWNAFVNPIFLLLLPVTVSLFYHISQRHAVVLREVRKLEAGSVSGMADILREVYQGASTVRCMALQDRLREEYCRALDTVNTASMVVYLADRWVELRLHLLTALAVCSAAMLGVVVTVSYSRPSLTAVAMIAALRSGPVLQTMCKTLGRFSVLEWISVQRLMSLWSVPQEPLTLEGDADLYNYSHVRRRASGFYVELEGGEDAPLLDLVGTPISSPKTLAAVSEQERREEKDRKRKKKHAMLSAASAAALGGLDTDASVSAAAPDSSLSAFAAPSTSSSASSSDADTAAPPRAAQQRTGDITTITLPQLELRNVSARYRTTLPYVLRHVNLAVYPRERLGVVGHAGQGKGSLFNVLMRLVDVIEGGGVFIDGENAARVPYPVLRGWFGLIPQEPLLVHGSWRTNLLMGYHPEHRVFIESANGTDDRPYLPIATLARQQQQQQQQAAAAAGGTRTTTTAALAAHLASVNEKGSPLTAGGRGAADQRNRRRRRRSSRGAASRDDSAASLPMSDSYGSTDSAQTYGEGEEPSRVRFANSMEEGDEEEMSPAGPRSSGGGALRSSLARVARRLRDKLTPFQHRSSRSGTASGRRECTPSGDAGPTRASSSGSGGGRRRRRRSSQQASSRGVSGHAVEGPRQPVEDAALWAALRAVGLDTAVEFDGGLDAPLVGGDVSEADLTESQCRLLCLARAVLNKPPIVLLEDAVLSGAEAQTDRAIRRVLANELRDATVIIIAHRMSTVLNLCTRVVAVREGTLLPIADLRSATSSAAASPQPQEGMRTNVSSTASLFDMSTPPPAAANVHPDVMRQLSYYVE